MKTYAIRLHPGQLLKEEIDALVSTHEINGGIMLTCVGNLQKAIIRMANAEVINTYEGTCEIVSLVGTVEKGNSHLHISISDTEGKVIGGHLKNGSVVGITAEVVVGVLDNYAFRREFDKETGYKELVIEESHL